MNLTDAIVSAAYAHNGQVYRGFGGRADEPYILHALRVMMRVSERARIAAVLHDVLEDHGELPAYTDPLMLGVLQLLTRDKDFETYQEYIERIATATGETGDIAREVKLADLSDNLSNGPPINLYERYMAARNRLNKARNAALPSVERAVMAVGRGEQPVERNDGGHQTNP